MPSEMFPAFTAGYCLKIDIVPFRGENEVEIFEPWYGNAEHPYFHTALSLHELHHALLYASGLLAWLFSLDSVPYGINTSFCQGLY